MTPNRLVAVTLLFVSLHSGNATEQGRGMTPLPTAMFGATRSIDWGHSAAIIVGIQQFHAGGMNLHYAVDDAVDLAYLLIVELRLMPGDRVVLLLAGRPCKPASRAH